MGFLMVSRRDKLVGLLLLSMFSFCSWATRDVSYGHRQRIDTLFQEIPLRREAMLEAVLRSNNNLSSSYAALDKSKTNVTRAVDELERLLRGPSDQGQAELLGDLKKIREQLKADFQAIDDFKAERSLLQNSLIRLPRAYHQAYQSASEPEQRLLKDLLLETMLYHENLEENYRIPILEDMKRLPSPANATILTFLKHINTIVATDPERMLRLLKLLQPHDSSSLARLKNTYHAMQNLRMRQRTLVVVFQCAMFVLLLGFLAITLRQLNQTIGQVHTINRNLEQSVRERTSSLEESYVQQRTYQAELARSQRLESVGQLAAGIAHEINTPIQFIGDNTRFLQDSFEQMQALLSKLQTLPDGRVQELVAAEDLGYLEKEIPLALQQSLDGLGRVSEVVHSLKTFAHPGGKIKVQANVNEMLRNTMVLARNEWRYVAEVELQLDEQLPPVTCYASDLNQVLLNLVVNAAHAVQDKLGVDPSQKGSIGVKTYQEDQAVFIQISDSGVGMSDEIREHVFDAFFTTKNMGRGTGQGLSIAYDIVVHKHGGKLSCQSTPGAGTCFVVSLPLVLVA
mgnify:CR=1 FL=1